MSRQSIVQVGKFTLRTYTQVQVLEAGAALLGKRDVVQRLCGNLQLDISKARKMLEWKPPVSVDEGLRRAVAGLP